MSVSKYQCPRCSNIDVHECTDSIKRRRQSAFFADRNEACMHCDRCVHVWMAWLDSGEPVSYGIYWLGRRRMGVPGGIHGE